MGSRHETSWFDRLTMRFWGESTAGIQLGASRPIVSLPLEGRDGAKRQGWGSCRQHSAAGMAPHPATATLPSRGREASGTGVGKHGLSPIGYQLMYFLNDVSMSRQMAN